MTAAPPAPPVAAGTAPAPRRMWNEVETLLLPESEKARNVVELIHRSVERIPNKEALRWKPSKAQREAAEGRGEPLPTWVSRSYAEFWDWITDVSLGLQGLGVADGDAICIMSRTRPEWLVADIAAWALGAVSCPIYPQTEAGQAEFILNNTGAVAVFVENAQQAAKVESIRANCPNLRHVITFDTSGKFPAGTLTLEELGSRAFDEAQRAGWEARWRAIDREHLATVIHTSGTTANPKGAMIRHGNLLYNYEAAVQIVDFYEADVFLSWLPLSHIFERLTGEIIPLAHGSTVVYAESLIERLADNMVEVQPTVMAAVPRFYERVYGRVVASVEASPPIAAADLPLGDWRGAEAVREPRRRARGWAGPEGPARHRGQARLPPGQGPDRWPGPLLRLWLGAAVARGGGVLLRPGHPHPRGLRAVRDEPAGEHQPAR